MPLAPGDHGMLNRFTSMTGDDARELFRRCRERYAGDTVALQEIDVYDPQSEYAVHLRVYRDAVRAGDGVVGAREET